jgi:hypothetical protein
MGMRIGNSGSAGATQSTGVSGWQQRQQDFKDLFSSLKSGDLAGAQTAFSGLSGGSAGVNASSPLAQIGQALQNGDLAGAQQAAQAFQANRSGGGHHHHHGGSSAAGTASSATPAAATGTGSAGVGALLNLTA